MSTASSSLEVVHDTLQSLGKLSNLRRSHWRLTLRGSRQTVSARLDRDWLQLAAECRWGRPEPHPSGGAPNAGDWLALNATLPGPIKTLDSAGGRTCRLVADLHLLDDLDLSPRIAHGLAGLVEAGRRVRQWSASGAALAGEADPRPVVAPGVSATVPVEVGGGSDWLTTLAQESGWPFQSRGNRPAFQLEVAEHYVAACLEPTADGGCRLLASLDTPDDLSSVSREAVEQLLLSAGGAVRLARAVASGSSDGRQYAWEVRWPARPVVAELRSALAALSVAASLTAGELQLLADEALARLFLEVRGRSSQVCSSIMESLSYDDEG